MKLVALTGPIYSGKTSLAVELEGRGYMRVMFNDLLKAYAATGLSSCGVPTSLHDILTNKAKYRAFLQELGDLIGFNNNPEHVHKALFSWVIAGRPPCVFDNVRTDEQADVVRSLGFQIVRLDLPSTVQIERAGALGVRWDVLQSQLIHPIERGISHWDLALDATEPLTYNADLIVRFVSSF